MRVLIRMGEIEDKSDLPRAEVQALAMELLLEKAGKRGFFSRSATRRNIEISR